MTTSIMSLHSSYDWPSTGELSLAMQILLTLLLRLLQLLLLLWLLLLSLLLPAVASASAAAAAATATLVGGAWRVLCLGGYLTYYARQTAELSGPGTSLHGTPDMPSAKPI